MTLWRWARGNTGFAAEYRSSIGRVVRPVCIVLL